MAFDFKSWRIVNDRMYAQLSEQCSNLQAFWHAISRATVSGFAHCAINLNAVYQDYNTGTLTYSERRTKSPLVGHVY